MNVLYDRKMKFASLYLTDRNGFLYEQGDQNCALFLSLSLCVSVSLSIYILYTYIYICVYICVYICIYINILMCVYICTYLPIYLFVSLFGLFVMFRYFVMLNFFIAFWFITFLKRRSSSSEVSRKIGVLKYFANFIGKHLYRSVFPATLLRQRFRYSCFSMNFAKVLRTPIL